MLKFLFYLLLFYQSQAQLYDPEELTSFEHLVNAHGFRLRQYVVTSEDGYWLTLYRIVSSDFNSTAYNLNRKPVILWHGILTNAHMWWINSPHDEKVVNGTNCGDNFGFCLVASGRYDAWAVNARGTRESQTHVNFTVEAREYWQFLFQHMAQYDLPAILSFVQKNWQK